MCNPWDVDWSVSCMCGSFDPQPEFPDQGGCNPPAVKRTCEEAPLPLTGYPAEASYNPDLTPAFTLIT